MSLVFSSHLYLNPAFGYKYKNHNNKNTFKALFFYLCSIKHSKLYFVILLTITNQLRITNYEKQLVSLQKK